MDASRRRSFCPSAAIWMLLAGLLSGCETPGDPTGTAHSALVPPPPVNQNIGIYDRAFTGLAAGDCLSCHDGTAGTTCPDPTTNCQVVSLRHHMMLDPSNPRYKPSYRCLSCHSPDPSTGNMSVTFDCIQCHSTSPHHRSPPAQARHCATCHGSLVNDYDDGHYIPKYRKSIITPAANCRVWADASHTTCAAGGCWTCHAASTAISPNVASSSATHHGTGLGQSPNPPGQCGWCHSISTNSSGAPTAAIDIRTCETCHGPTSLHAIEYQYNTHIGTAGYGHIGAPQDCWGCHGFFDLYSDSPAVPAVPTAESVQPASVDSGAATELVIAGQSFTDTVPSSGGAVRTFTPVVVLSLLDGAGTETERQAVVPTRFTESEVRATVPATLRPGHWDVRVYKDYQGTQQNQSNKLSLAVRPKVTVSSAKLCVKDHTLTVTGIGFGPQPFPGTTAYGLFVGAERCAVSSWSDTSIAGTCSTATPAAQATVIGLFNGNSPAGTKMTGGSCN